MARGHKFDPARIAKLDNPERLSAMQPDAIWDEFNVPPSATLLDFGAGTGVFARYFAQRLSSGRIFACDVSQTMLDYLRDSLSESDREKIVPVLTEESAVPLPAESIDLIFAINVYHELENASATLDELCRLLVPRGRLAVIDWEKSPTEEGPPLDHRVGADELLAEVTMAGFAEHRWVETLPQHFFLVATRTRT